MACARYQRPASWSRDQAATWRVAHRRSQTVAPAPCCHSREGGKPSPNTRPAGYFFSSASFMMSFALAMTFLKPSTYRFIKAMVFGGKTPLR